MSPSQRVLAQKIVQSPPVQPIDPFKGIVRYAHYDPESASPHKSLIRNNEKPEIKIPVVREHLRESSLSPSHPNFMKKLYFDVSSINPQP